MIGLQEAGQADISGADVSPYQDLVNRLNAAGAPYAVSDPAREASKGTRILYNTETMQLRDKRSLKYSSQKTGQNPRYLTWGRFKQKSTGKSVLFASTHP